MHTEGPWMFHGPDHNIHVCEERDPNMRVCFMTSTGPTVERARLIAAAPDMLALLRLFAVEYENQNINHMDFRVSVKMRAEEMIAKATEPRP